MELKKAIEILEHHNTRCAKNELITSQAELNKAIDTVVKNFPNYTKMELTWMDIRDIVRIANRIAANGKHIQTDAPIYLDDNYYREILNRFLNMEL